jgi:hypothetical protein
MTTPTNELIDRAQFHSDPGNRAGGELRRIIGETRR